MYENKVGKKFTKLKKNIMELQARIDDRPPKEKDEFKDRLVRLKTEAVEKMKSSIQHTAHVILAKAIALDLQESDICKELISTCQNVEKDCTCLAEMSSEEHYEELFTGKTKEEREAEEQARLAEIRRLEEREIEEERKRQAREVNRQKREMAAIAEKEKALMLEEDHLVLAEMVDWGKTPREEEEEEEEKGGEGGEGGGEEGGGEGRRRRGEGGGGGGEGGGGRRRRRRRSVFNVGSSNVCKCFLLQRNTTVLIFPCFSMLRGYGLPPCKGKFPAQARLQALTLAGDDTSGAGAFPSALSRVTVVTPTEDHPHLYIIPNVIALGGETQLLLIGIRQLKHTIRRTIHPSFGP